MSTQATRAERNVQLANLLLDWNREHLRSETTLSEPVIGERFAPELVVEANGRRYEATLGSYKEFLEGFKRTIASIDYQVREVVADAESVVLALEASVTRTGGDVDRFDAMLLLKFDEQEKVRLWHEVYVQRPKGG